MKLAERIFAVDEGVIEEFPEWPDARGRPTRLLLRPLTLQAAEEVRALGSEDAERIGLETLIRCVRR